MSSTTLGVDKICLKNTMMHSVLVRKYGIHGCKYVRWSVTNFDKLKNNVIYCGHCIETNWDLTLTKIGEWSFIEVCINEFNQETSRIVFRTTKPRMDIDAELISKGKFQLKFRNFGSNILQGDSLEMFFFYYRATLNPKGAILCNSTRTVSDISTLGEGLFRMYQRQLLTNFMICVPGRQFRVHKAILTAQSEFFESYIRNLPENVEGKIEIAADPFIMDIVLRFIYSSEVVVNEIQHVIEVSHLAKKLKLKKLQVFCRFLLAVVQNNENRSRLLEAANNLALKKDNLDCVDKT